MAGIDGMAAADTLLSFGTVTPGYCLHYVWQAYKAHGAVCYDSYPTAYSAWLASSFQHPGDWNPPPGVPVYLAPKYPGQSGDVMISRGGGLCSATDWPYYGVTGICSIQQRVAQTGDPYLGWTEDILGNQIQQGGGGGHVPGKEDEEMAIGYVNITGKSGQRRGGMYAVVARPGAKPYAVFVGGAGPDGMKPVSDDKAVGQLQGLIDGLA